MQRSHRSSAFCGGGTFLPVRSVDDQPIGMTYGSLAVLGPAAVPDVARRAAELGYSSFWTTEANGTDAFTPLRARAPSAPQLDLATGIVPIQIRSPAVTAMTAATLQAMVPDRRVLLGVGISTPVVVGAWHGAGYGDQPIAQMREYLALLRELLSGETVDFDGDFHRVKRFRLGVRLASTGRSSSSPPSTRRCCASPGSWPTACCSTTSPPPTSRRGRRGGAGRRLRRDLLLRARRGDRLGAGRGRPSATCSATSWPTATRRCSVPPGSTTWSPR